MRADRAAGDPVRAELRRRRGARPADRGDARGARRDLGLAERLAQALGSATFRPYHSTDVRGVEIGGAAKNVLAIAAGIVTGRGLGASAAAALTTRGFAELVRFGRALGARPETLTGLSGLGDLMLTCSSPQSRNFSLGIALGKGETAERGQRTASWPKARSPRRRWSNWRSAEERRHADRRRGRRVLGGTLSVDAAIESLLTRPAPIGGVDR